MPLKMREEEQFPWLNDVDMLKIWGPRNTRHECWYCGAVVVTEKKGATQLYCRCNKALLVFPALKIGRRFCSET